jgi:hypothetical protein
MGMNIGLYKDKIPVQVGRHQEGNIYAIGGSQEAEIGITYNYAKLTYGEAGLSKEHMLDVLQGMTGKDSIPLLERAVAFLGTMRSEDYWEATPGNAGYALSILLGWARLHPDAVWDIYSR